MDGFDHLLTRKLLNPKTMVDPIFSTTKKVLDPIHNFIDYDNFFWKFIDTIEFQRLRELKQLGGVHYVFPGANHTRFEHCLGTGYLAQKLIKNIFKHQPDIREEFDSQENTQRIQKNVTLAGLLHDLGHGPFSHLFDGKIVAKLCPEAHWTHERGSTMLFEKLIDNNHIDIEKEDIEMVSDLILGNREPQKYADKVWIFDIVSNSKTSIDVDKYDYMTRDSFHLGLKDTYFDYRTLIKESRVIGTETCFPAKLCHKVYELFQVRYKLYRDVYHNRAANSIELMLEEALMNANSHYKFLEIISDPDRYVHMTDYVIKDIEISGDPELETSKQIIKRIKQRDLYRFASETIINIKNPLPDLEQMKVDIVSCANHGGTEGVLTVDDIRISTGSNTYGLKEKNPVECVTFYNKNNIAKSFRIDKDQVSLLLPEKFGERYVRIFTTDVDKIEQARNAFDKYCKRILHSKMGPVESTNSLNPSLRASKINSPEN